MPCERCWEGTEGREVGEFDDYIREVEEHAKAGGPEALARWDVFNAHFAMAREVRQLRKERHVTQKQLAAATGINQTGISRIEHTNRGFEVSRADDAAATLAAERIRSGADQHAQDGAEALAELGIGTH
jgi:hypothetical protein